MDEEEIGGLFPFDDTEDVTVDDEEESYVLRDFEIDWHTMKLTGKIVEGIDAIEQWAQMALRSERYEWLIHSWDYGEEYTSLLGYSWSWEYLNSEVERYLLECLCEHPYITGITDLSIVVENEKMHISFTLVTDLGEVEIDV